MVGGISNLTDMSLRNLREIVKDRQACALQLTGSQRFGCNLATEEQIP